MVKYFPLPMTLRLKLSLRGVGENSLALAFLFNPPKQSSSSRDCFGGVLASREKLLSNIPSPNDI